MNQADSSEVSSRSFAVMLNNNSRTSQRNSLLNKSCSSIQPTKPMTARANAASAKKLSSSLSIKISTMSTTSRLAISSSACLTMLTNVPRMLFEAARSSPRRGGGARASSASKTAACCTHFRTTSMEGSSLAFGDLKRLSNSCFV
ncbi:hypothetical protein MRB53_037953 [Persea americana]|nr:hypothetical protein MRB53_037953 [Persea americana]